MPYRPLSLQARMTQLRALRQSATTEALRKAAEQALAKLEPIEAKLKKAA